ncbi:MAG: radical SAM family heme chaperone HemW [Saprospiraceae bacterium]|nr:radical SAM family heme chaperone HemW [Saprospiraceae bacterium]
MSGIYIHIPFCKKACHYCNFHFSTSLRLKDDMIEAICKEIELRKNYLSNKTLDSIYFGGGTPSLLKVMDLERIFEAIHSVYAVRAGAEITLEANPDDINQQSLDDFRKTGVNRLSIGIQSFFDTDLQWMNRAHSAIEAQNSVKLAQDAGYDNITIDLIYGAPTTTDEMWRDNIDQALKLDVPHISAYCLTVEENTALHHFIAKNKTAPPQQQKAVAQFDTLMKKLNDNGFLHYEISNFAKPGYLAVHNSNYWKGSHYIGIGPSAHSYDGASRCWNISHNKKYIDALVDPDYKAETEYLSISMKYNEYIMTSVRTMWGIDSDIVMTFGKEIQSYFLSEIRFLIEKEMISPEAKSYKLTQKGKHFADQVAMDLFFME